MPLFLAFFLVLYTDDACLRLYVPFGTFYEARKGDCYKYTLDLLIGGKPLLGINS